MSYLHDWRLGFLRLRSWLPLFLELSMTLASGRMGWLLLTDQTYFERFPNSYGWFVQHFPAEEWVYGLLAGAAALLKLVGMLCLLPRKSEHFMDAAFLLREVGWGLSVFFWVGVTLVLSRWDMTSLGAITTGAMAMFSVAGMLMGPAMPEEDLDALRG